MHIFGVDIGGSGIKGAPVDLDLGDLADERYKVLTPHPATPDAVADGVKGRLKWELRATWLGGMRILDRLEAIDFDVFHHRPALGVIDAAAIVGRVLVWR